MVTREQDIAGMGCILQFFQDMYNCIDAVNTYVIGLDETESKFPVPGNESDEVKKNVMSDEWQDYIKQMRINVRFSIMRCHLQLTGISEVIKGFDLKKLNVLYNNVLKTTTPDRKDCQDYISELYRCFIKSVLKDLLRNVEVYSDLIKE